MESKSCFCQLLVICFINHHAEPKNCLYTYFASLIDERFKFFTVLWSKALHVCITAVVTLFPPLFSFTIIQGCFIVIYSAFSQPSAVPPPT